MLVTAAVVGCGVIAAGCGTNRPVAPARSTATAGTSAQRVAPEKLLSGALSVLDRLDDFDEARGLELVFDRINQWTRATVREGGDGWKVDPLVESLPPRLREATGVAPLSGQTFTLQGDVTFLRDQRWLADIARVARGDAVDDLAVADRLFRWTVRSLAIVGDPPAVPTAASPGSRWFLPGEILLAGRASAAQRAWIFLELLRHAGLQGVMLATGDGGSGTVRPWVPGVVAGGEIHLFEPTFGMAIPGPDGRGIATVRMAAEDPAILEALSLPDRPYPLQAKDMQGLSVLVAADPWTLSRRMALLDRQLRTSRGMVVRVDASVVGEAARAALPDGGQSAPPRLWEFPWETVARRRDDAEGLAQTLARELAPMQATPPQSAGDGGSGDPIVRPLFAARVREFRGDLDGPRGAKAAYLAARPGPDALAVVARSLPPQQADAARAVFGQMKEDAAYWLGILTLAEKEYETAIDYLQRMTLEGAPDGRWSDAARANVAEAYIGLGRTTDAVAALRADLSPQRFGSRLRADRLEAEAKAGGRESP